jgi:hypothetical protein
MPSLPMGYLRGAWQPALEVCWRIAGGSLEDR